MLLLLSFSLTSEAGDRAAAGQPVASLYWVHERSRPEHCLGDNNADDDRTTELVGLLTAQAEAIADGTFMSADGFSVFRAGKMVTTTSDGAATLTYSYTDSYGVIMVGRNWHLCPGTGTVGHVMQIQYNRIAAVLERQTDN